MPVIRWPRITRRSPRGGGAVSVEEEARANDRHYCLGRGEGQVELLRSSMLGLSAYDPGGLQLFQFNTRCDRGVVHEQPWPYVAADQHAGIQSLGADHAGFASERSAGLGFSSDAAARRIQLQSGTVRGSLLANTRRNRQDMHGRGSRSNSWRYCHWTPSFKYSGNAS